MKKFIISLSLILMVFCSFALCVGCGKNQNNNEEKEKIELSDVYIGEISFENSKNVKLDEKDDTYVVSGKIDAMSKSQKNAFGDDNISHVVALKLTFNKEKTISKVVIKGNKTKTYSSDENDADYAGKLTDLLDNEEGEDAYCNLVLAASTKQYEIICSYSDKSESTVKLKIEASLVTVNDD